jgi:chromosome partitioning protein
MPGSDPTPPNPAPQRRIAFMNQKGGVGKTTTTVNVAAAFANAGRSTLLIDLDPQAHATLHVGIDPQSVERSVYDVLLDPDTDPAAALHDVRPNLTVLPAQTDLAAAESELAADADRNTRLERALSIIAKSRQFEFVLLDCPPSLGLLTLNALTLAREVIVPMQAHFLALQGVGKLLETIRLVASATNPRLRVTGIVLCAHDSTTTHTREVVADLESFFQQARNEESPWKFARVLKPAIRRNIKLAECPSFGQTIFEYAPQASGAEDYGSLAATLMKEWDDAVRGKGSRKSADPPAPAAAPQIEVRAGRSSTASAGSTPAAG